MVVESGGHQSCGGKVSGGSGGRVGRVGRGRSVGFMEGKKINTPGMEHHNRIQVENITN